MRIKGATIQQVILGLALLAALCWNLAQANEINRLQLDSDTTSTRAELHLQTTPSFKTFTLRHPDRFVIDLTGVDPGSTLQLPAPNGLIKAIRTGRPAEATTRIVFDLAAPAAARKPRLETGPNGVRLVLEWPNAAVIAVAPTTTKMPVTQGPATGAGSAATQAPLQAAAPGASVANLGASANSNVPSSAAPFSAPLTANQAPTTSAPLKPASPAASQVTANTGTNAGAPNPDSVAKPLPSAGGASTVTSGKVTSGTATLGTATPITAAPNAVAPDTAAPTTAAPLPMPRNLSGRPLIVAIDAGHGGQDPGAIGPTGKREKDVTLAIARELARQVNATPGLKAVMTRDSDMFLPLPRRTQFARQSKADIFISIHADAAENRNAKGSSVYVLSLRGASSQRARWLADKENAADLIGGHPLPKSDNTLTSVLLDLTQSGQMRASETAAVHVLTGLKDIGYNHKPNIERANFSVLRTSDMPAMLVETAFISNADEERRLTDPAYQRSLARAVLDGIDTYFRRQPPPGTLYAARAKAAEGAKSGAPIVVAKTTPATTGGSPE